VGGPWKQRTSPDSFVIVIVCEGEGAIGWADGLLHAKAGDCFLLPAPLGEYTLDGRMTVLRSRVP
jgi:mannose-6-phosphate isomerase